MLYLHWNAPISFNTTNLFDSPQTINISYKTKMIRDRKFGHNIFILILFPTYITFLKQILWRLLYAVVFYNRLNRCLFLTQSYGKDSEDLKYNTGVVWTLYDACGTWPSVGFLFAYQHLWLYSWQDQCILKETTRNNTVVNKKQQLITKLYQYNYTLQKILFHFLI